MDDEDERQETLTPDINDKTLLLEQSYNDMLVDAATISPGQLQIAPAPAVAGMTSTETALETTTCEAGPTDIELQK